MPFWALRHLSAVDLYLSGPSQTLDHRADESTCAMLTSGNLHSRDSWLCSTTWRAIHFVCDHVSLNRAE